MYYWKIQNAHPCRLLNQQYRNDYLVDKSKIIQDMKIIKIIKTQDEENMKINLIRSIKNHLNNYNNQNIDKWINDCECIGLKDRINILLCIPVNSSEIERTFNILWNIANIRRTKLKTKTINNYLLIRINK